MGSSVTATGLRELEQAIARFPADVEGAFKSTAHESADRIARHAARLLNAQTHGSGRTARAIRVLDESKDKQFIVNSPGDPDRPANLPLWLEYGTRFMTAKPHMRPAGDAENSRYKSAMVATAERTATKAFG